MSERIKIFGQTDPFSDPEAGAGERLDPGTEGRAFTPLVSEAPMSNDGSGDSSKKQTYQPRPGWPTTPNPDSVKKRKRKAEEARKKSKPGEPYRGG